LLAGPRSGDEAGCRALHARGPWPSICEQALRQGGWHPWSLGACLLKRLGFSRQEDEARATPDERPGPPQRPFKKRPRHSCEKLQHTHIKNKAPCGLFFQGPRRRIGQEGDERATCVWKAAGERPARPFATSASHSALHLCGRRARPPTMPSRSSCPYVNTRGDAGVPSTAFAKDDSAMDEHRSRMGCSIRAGLARRERTARSPTTSRCCRLAGPTSARAEPGPNAYGLFLKERFPLAPACHASYDCGRRPPASQKHGTAWPRRGSGALTSAYAPIPGFPRSNVRRGRYEKSCTPCKGRQSRHSPAEGRGALPTIKCRNWEVARTMPKRIERKFQVPPISARALGFRAEGRRNLPSAKRRTHPRYRLSAWGYATVRSGRRKRSKGLQRETTSSWRRRLIVLGPGLSSAAPRTGWKGS